MVDCSFNNRKAKTTRVFIAFIDMLTVCRPVSQPEIIAGKLLICRSIRVSEANRKKNKNKFRGDDFETSDELQPLNYMDKSKLEPLAL